MTRFRKETIRLLTQYEGRRAQPYKDTEGNWTVGIGHDLDANPLKYSKAVTIPEIVPVREYRLSNAEMDALLLEDIARAEIDYKRLGLPTWNHPTSREILIRMIFQMGLEGVRGFHKMLKALSMGHYRWAGLEMLDSEWARTETPVRAAEEARRMMDLDAE